ncbi:hypothetical protein [Caulobacter mirabilis]|uniref:Uncharacterized protein n=1 Tax=Caulobacter mirabilis TaxID=69666 RepID=A0A2D2B2Z4_9CAUL|nr:hypothetical protein [Caulobacter mirabilis]ATQ44613.1 hypothetical protein CSW64_20560 [Caulobacter mirabilis]
MADGYAFETIENSSQDLDDLVDASIRPFHQSLTTSARQGADAGVPIVCPGDVDIDDFGKNLHDVLDRPSWAAVKQAYARIDL